jgi:hypothetical protein
MVMRPQRDAGHVLQQGDVHVRGAADAGGAVADRAGLLSGACDQLGDRVHTQRGMGDQRLRVARKPADRGEVGVGVVGQGALGVEIGIADEGTALAHHQGVAVVRRLGDGGGPDVVTGAALVLDDDRLAPQLGKALADPARDQIREPAGRRRHHHGDGP